MRVVWMVFIGLLLALALVLPRLRQGSTSPAPFDAPADQPSVFKTVLLPAQGRTTSFAAPRAQPPAGAALADSVVAFGLAQRGAPYAYAGTSPVTGFDCSGFIMYTFARFGVAVPHSTALLIDVGSPVNRAAAQPADIVVFTGTDSASTSPGHAGIVVSGRGEVPLRFVHASSARRESGVKVSQVEGTGYERRFMQVRRVLGTRAVPATRLGPPAPQPVARPRTAVAVAGLRHKVIPVESTALPASEPPATLQPKKLSKPTARKAVHAALRKAAIKKRSLRKTDARVTSKKVVPRKAAVKKPASRKKAAPAKKTGPVRKRKVGTPRK